MGTVNQKYGNTHGNNRCEDGNANLESLLYYVCDCGRFCVHKDLMRKWSSGSVLC